MASNSEEGCYLCVACHIVEFGGWNMEKPRCDQMCYWYRSRRVVTKGDRGEWATELAMATEGLAGIHIDNTTQSLE